MKKQTKIVATLLSLLLLVTACVGIAVSADGEKALTVISQNVEYADNLHLYYAVYPENVDVDGLVLNVYTENPDVNAEAEILATVANHEEVVLADSEGTTYTCRAFKTPGVALKNMATKFYVQAVAADGTKSPVKSYSVVEYFNEMIYNAEDEADVAAYEKMLAAGDAAQHLLDYYPNGNKNDIPTNYKYIVVKDGTVNGAKKGLFLAGETVTVNYTGTEGAKCWNLVGFDGNVVGSASLNGSFAVSDSVVCTPSNSFRGSGKYASNVKALSFTGTTATDVSQIMVGDGNKNQKLSATQNGTLDGGGSYDATIVTVDNDSALKIKSASSAESTHRIAADKVGTKYVFETDMMLESGSTTRSDKVVFQFIGTIDGSANWWGITSPSIKATTTDGVTTYTFVAGDASYEIALGEWFNFRLELDNTGSSGNAVRYYINGELLLEKTNTQTTTALRYIKIWSPGSSGGVLYLDNTYYSAQ